MRRVAQCFEALRRARVVVVVEPVLVEDAHQWTEFAVHVQHRVFLRQTQHTVRLHDALSDQMVYIMLEFQEVLNQPVDAAVGNRDLEVCPWERSGDDALLWVAGNVEPAVADRCRQPVRERQRVCRAMG